MLVNIWIVSFGRNTQLSKIIYGYFRSGIATKSSLRQNYWRFLTGIFCSDNENVDVYRTTPLPTLYAGTSDQPQGKMGKQID